MFDKELVGVLPKSWKFLAHNGKPSCIDFIELSERRMT